MSQGYLMHASVRIINTSAISQQLPSILVSIVFIPKVVQASLHVLVCQSLIPSQLVLGDQKNLNVDYETPCTVAPPVVRMGGGRVELAC